MEFTAETPENKDYTTEKKQETNTVGQKKVENKNIPDYDTMKDKTLYDIVESMGLKFFAVADDLAKMAGIQNYDRSAKQNIEIRRKILN
jgi:hypothetical protein